MGKMRWKSLQWRTPSASAKAMEDKMAEGRPTEIPRQSAFAKASADKARDDTSRELIGLILGMTWGRPCGTLARWLD
jgi:hypothetical protein